MRILPLAVIALAVLTGCSSSQRSAAPAPQPTAASGSMETMPQGDTIDRFAAAYAASHPNVRY